MICRELSLPCDPVSLARRLQGAPGLALLHSGLQAYGFGRYSILAAHPRKTFVYRNGVAEVSEGGRIRRRAAPLLAAMKEELPSTATEADALPFAGGAIGYLAYEAGRYWEPAAYGSRQDETACDARFNCYDGAVVFDHAAGRVHAAGEGAAFGEGLQATLEALQAGPEPAPSSFRLSGPLESNFTRQEYLAAVARVREEIRDGSVYQVNLSQRFSAPCSGSSFELYRSLAVASPAPYSAYLQFDDEQILSSSPELFLQAREGRVRTRPIKGTRPAGASEEEAAAYARDLAGSEKDRSELLMIVDLERNDLGRVCRPGSVAVHGLFALERYATVMHQTAEVRGELEADRHPLDCLPALFPGGSITGAPKISAMLLIERLERSRRGVYTGAIGHIGAGGACEFNIAIRTIRVSNGAVSFQVGGGIVWDSDPESEYEETLLKAKAMMKAMGGGDA